MTTQTLFGEAENTNFPSPSNPIPAVDLAHSVSINTVPSLHNEFLFNETLRGGFRFEGRMSDVRRFFCLFVTFDILFIGLMWLICIMLNGESIWNALDQQIKHYKITTSLFDLVFLAACRFILLLLFYGILYINHWIIILITTSFTCAFSIAKVFYYNWHQTPQPMFEVLLVLVTFILAWGEAWFLDYRVIPQEAYAKQFLISTTDERAPLIRHYLRGATPSRYTESVDNFHSPMNSPEGSLHRFNTDNNHVTVRYPPYDYSPEEVNEFASMTRNIIDESKELLRSEKWTLDRESEDITAYTMTLPKGNKIFKVVACFNTSPRNMLDELFYGVENIPKWNSALLQAQRVQILDEYTDIIYQLSASGAGGLVSSRDFVSLRCWTEVDDDSFIISSKATKHPNIPKNTKYVRGENGVACLLLEPHDGNSNRCKMQFILNTNLKGWIPQAIVDLALIDTLYDYIKDLRSHIDQVYKK